MSVFLYIPDLVRLMQVSYTDFIAKQMPHKKEEMRSICNQLLSIKFSDGKKI